jgi:hypothetical protein
MRRRDLRAPGADRALCLPQGVRTQMLADSESTGEIMLADAVSSLRWKLPLDRLRCRMANWAIAPE